MSNFWTDKVVLITGASSGIGRALAEAVARRGAKPALIARREPLLESLCASIRASGGQAGYAAADVTDSGGLCAAVRRLESQHGPIDVLIANAGLYRKTDGAAFDAQRAAQVMATNVIGFTNALGAVLPGMVERRCGRLCVVSSMGAFLSLPSAGAYCASKAAVATFMKSIRLDVRKHGIQATTVYPGFVDTAMITEHERRTLRGLLTADTVADRILWAVERGRGEYAFPFSLWLECRLAGLLPWWLYRRVMATVAPMEET